MNKLSILFFALSLACIARAQNTCFQKVYTLSDTTVIFNNVFVDDSTYILSGSMGRGTIRFNPVICLLDKFGNEIDTDVYLDNDYLHKTSYSYTELDKNIDSQFVLHYTTIDKNETSFWLHSLLKWDETTGFGPEKFLDTLTSGFFTYLDGARMLLSNADSTYYTLSNYFYNSALDTSNTLPNNSGLFLIKFAQVTDSILWMKRITFNLTTTNGPTIGQVNLLLKSDGTCVVVAQQIYNNSAFNDQYCRVLFYTINTFNGDLLSTKQLQDTPWSSPGFGATFINDEKDLLISYTESDTLYTTTTIPQPYYAVRPTVTRLDSNFNVVWKDTLRTYYSTTLACGGCIEKQTIQGDSTFTGAHTYIDIQNESQPNQSIYYTLRITNRNQVDGFVNWNRDYSYYPVIGNNYIANYDIHDAENTLDGGYIFVGESTNFDSLNANAPGQLGYVLKTNCLGFLDDPQAGFSAESNDSLGVSFQNGSLMGGSYLWDFGDGTLLETGENLDSVFHQYSDSGTFQITLIAYGCNGVNDTIVSSVYVSKYNEPEPPVNPNIVNYMALGPNPVQSGESIAVYVGNLPSENCWLAFYDEQGKLVLEHAIQQSKSTNIIVLPFGTGVYQAVLRDGKEELEIEKVLVY